VAELLSLSACIEAIEPAFIAHDEGRTLGPAILGVPAGDEGAFHIKAAGVTLGHRYFAAKLNGNFSRNPQQRGLPAIQGVIVLADADTGTPLAVLDSIDHRGL
jgi:ornithine cyclodeaminase/alanine dehydrogenase-like protein (mu-crystallin family)